MENIVASLLRQIASQSSLLPPSLIELHTKFRDQNRGTQIQDLELTLLLVCQDFNQVFIAIDALDECDEIMRQKYFLPFLTTLQQSPRIRLFITSRPYPEDIRNALGAAPQVIVEASDTDLRKYLRRRIEESGNVEVIDEEFRQILIETIAKGAQKMYVDQFSLSSRVHYRAVADFDSGFYYRLYKFSLLSMNPLLGRWKTQLKLCRMTYTRPSIRLSPESEGSLMAESDWA